MKIQEILKQAVLKNASDIHLVVGLKPILRIDGELESLDKEVKISNAELKKEVFSILNEDQKERFISEYNLDFGYALKSGERFRMNLFYEKTNFGLVARVIKEQKPTLEEVGMPVEVTQDLLNSRQGLILVTGPTGCGKSTTLASMIEYINNNRRCNIITFEDPIEFLFESKNSIIVQRQVGSDMKDFASGLKYALRQDPDVVMVGEMRDLETIATTITLAETGHLVLATLHTYNAAQTIDRIIDIFPPHQQNQIRSQISTTLKAVFSQRLLTRSDEDGRIAAREIMINNPAIANLIREGKISQIKNTIETNKDKGMVVMDSDIKNLYKEGVISKEEAKNNMANPDSLK